MDNINIQKTVETEVNKILNEYIPKKINDYRIEWQVIFTHSRMWDKTDCFLRIVMYGRYGKHDDRKKDFMISWKGDNLISNIENGVTLKLKDFLFDYLAMANRASL